MLFIFLLKITLLLYQNTGFAIVAYLKKHLLSVILGRHPPGPFSAPGDSGSIIFDRIGRIVALLTGGGWRYDRRDRRKLYCSTGPRTGGSKNR